MAIAYKREGSPKWYIDYVDHTNDGKRKRRSTTCRTKREAQQLAEETEEATRLEFESRRGIRLIEAASLFFQTKAATNQLKPKTIELYKENLAAVYRTLGDIPLASVNKSTIQGYLKSRLAEGGKVQIGKEMGFMSSLYSTIIDLESSVTENPWKDFEKKNVPKAKVVDFAFTDEAFRKLYKACNHDEHRHILVLAVETGMRKQEILKLHQDEVDFDTRMITLQSATGERTKTGAKRVIPMSDGVYDSLMSQKLAHLAYAENNRFYGTWSGYFFENHSTKQPRFDTKTWWYAAKKRAGLKEGRFHDLRHTFATRGMRVGANQLTLMQIMGHADSSSFQRYVTATEEAKWNAINLMSNGTHLAQRNPGSDQPKKGA